MDKNNFNLEEIDEFFNDIEKKEEERKRQEIMVAAKQMHLAMSAMVDAGFSRKEALQILIGVSKL